MDGVIDPLGTDFQVKIKETLGKTCFRFFHGHDRAKSSACNMGRDFRDLGRMKSKLKSKIKKYQNIRAIAFDIIRYIVIMGHGHIRNQCDTHLFSIPLPILSDIKYSELAASPPMS